MIWAKTVLHPSVGDLATITVRWRQAYPLVVAEKLISFEAIPAKLRGIMKMSDYSPY
jgi:hypothetical protein